MPVVSLYMFETPVIGVDTDLWAVIIVDSVGSTPGEPPLLHVDPNSRFVRQRFEWVIYLLVMKV